MHSIANSPLSTIFEKIQVYRKKPSIFFENNPNFVRFEKT